MIYIREAHPKDTARARAGWSKVRDPRSLEERLQVARACRDELGLPIPFAVDALEDGAAKAYAAHPDRLFIVSPDGRIAYRSSPGPKGFKLDEMAERLAEVLTDSR